MVSLKKIIICLLACCNIFCFFTLTVLAQESAITVSNDHITLDQTQKEFEATIEVKPDNAYAGIEIAVACPNGVTVRDSSSSSGSMSAHPVLANDLYWMSFFESDNKLSGAMKITLHLSCQESFTGGTIQLQTVKVFTRNGVAVDTKEYNPSKEIRITRNSPKDVDSSTNGNDEVLVSLAVAFMFIGVIIWGIFYKLRRKRSN